MADVPPTLAPLLPAEGDNARDERMKANLARRIAEDFIAVGDGLGVQGCLEVLLQVATREGIRARTRAAAARDYVRLALRAAELEAAADGVGPDVLPATGAAPTRELYIAVLSDPAGRAALLAGLSTRLGVARPVVAVRPGQAEAAALDVVATSPKRKPKPKRKPAKPNAASARGTP